MPISCNPVLMNPKILSTNHHHPLSPVSRIARATTNTVDEKKKQINPYLFPSRKVSEGCKQQEDDDGILG